MYSYRIEQAIRAAAVLHNGQTRRGRTPFPYITHLFSTALIASDYTDNEDIIVAAVLHDSVEDTDYTFEELQEDFGGTVRDLVEGVTEPDVAQDESERNWKEGKQAYIKHLRKAPDGSLIIAAADKIHNMRSIVEDYYEHHEDFLRDFGGSLDDRLRMYEEVSNILNRRLKNGILNEFNNVFREYKNFIAYVKKEAGRI